MITRFLIVLCCFAMGCKGVSQEKDLADKGDAETVYKVNKSDAEWRSELSDLEYFILRKAGTETAGTSELLYNKEKGTYTCAGCGAALFRSENKFNSGTGWPLCPSTTVYGAGDLGTRRSGYRPATRRAGLPAAPALRSRVR